MCWLQIGFFLAVSYYLQMLAMGIFGFTKFTIDFRGFRVLVFCHRAYHRAYWKTQKQRKILVCYFSNGSPLLSYYLENLVNHSVCLGQKCRSIAQCCQCK